MKTLCLSLGLLLLTVCCCDTARLPSTMLATCCTNVTTIKVPPRFIRDIIKIDSACSLEAFIITTTRGSAIRYSQTYQWAVNVFNKHHINKLFCTAP